MLKRPTFFLLLVVLLSVSFILISAPTSDAATMSHNTDPPGVIVVPGSPPTSTSGPSCHNTQNIPNNDFLLLYYHGPAWSNTSQNGPILCIYYNAASGSATVNLTRIVDGRNWDNNVSAFWTGCQDVGFFKKIDGGGTSAYAAGSIYGALTDPTSFPYQGIGNDQLSSVTLIAGAHIC